MLKASSWNELKSVIENNEILLSPTIGISIQALLQTLRSMGVGMVEDRFRLYQQLLKNCREIGTEAAIEKIKEQIELAPFE